MLPLFVQSTAGPTSRFQLYCSDCLQCADDVSFISATRLIKTLYNTLNLGVLWGGGGWGNNTGFELAALLILSPESLNQSAQPHHLHKEEPHHLHKWGGVGPRSTLWGGSDNKAGHCYAISVRNKLNGLLLYVLHIITVLCKQQPRLDIQVSFLQENQQQQSHHPVDWSCINYYPLLVNIYYYNYYYLPGFTSIPVNLWTFSFCGW